MAEAIQTLGNWHNLRHTAAQNRLMLNAEQLAQHWRRVSLTADFWANYLTSHLAENATNEQLDRDAAHGIVSYLLNELFENCAKFSNGSVKTICFEVSEDEGQLLFVLTNHIAPEAKLPLIEFLNSLLEGDPAELYFKRIEENAESGHSGSGLGYLTLMMDYGIRFGFRFRPVDENSVALDVQAQVSLSR